MKIEWSKFDDEVLKGVDLCKQINNFGYEAYIVGGCVRDIVLWYKNGQKGEPNIHDVDITTNMPIDELYDNFKCTSNNGEAHGTILVIHKGIAFEVTQFRVDGDYSDGRHPDSVKFTKSFKDDTARRDFTINAMGIDADGNLIDYYGGEQDLDNKILRTVGDSNARFNEDALRIIRAIRFAARFDMKIDDATYKSICDLKSKINGLAMERISAELKKTAEYGIKQFAYVIKILVETGACDNIDNQYINWDALNRVATYRVTHSIQPELAKDPMTSMVLLLLNSDDIEKTMYKMKLDVDTLKCAKYVEHGIDVLRNFEEDLVTTVKVCNDKNFIRLLEIANLYGVEVPDNKLEKIEELIDNVMPLQKQVSQEIQKEGITGQRFGNELHDRMLKKYKDAYRVN